MALSQPAASVPVGAVQAFAKDATPNGWIFCNGSEISRTAYAKLFAKIGTTYGAGDGSTTFNVPDLRGEFIRGWGSGGPDAGRVFGSGQLDQFQGHAFGDDIGILKRDFDGGNGSSNNVQTNATDTDIVIKSDGVNGEPRYGSETRPRNISLYYCIKY